MLPRQDGTWLCVLRETTEWRDRRAAMNWCHVWALVVCIKSRAGKIAYSPYSLAGGPPTLDGRTRGGSPNKIVVHYDKLVNTLGAITSVATRSFLAKKDALSFGDVCAAFHIYPAHRARSVTRVEYLK